MRQRETHSERETERVRERQSENGEIKKKRKRTQIISICQDGNIMIYTDSDTTPGFGFLKLIPN